MGQERPNPLRGSWDTSPSQSGLHGRRQLIKPYAACHRRICIASSGITRGLAHAAFPLAAALPS